MKDSAGKNFFPDFVKMANQGGGWVDYKWSNPTTKKLQDKSTYIVGLPESKVLFGCGVYKTK